MGFKINEAKANPLTVSAIDMAFVLPKTAGELIQETKRFLVEDLPGIFKKKKTTQESSDGVIRVQLGNTILPPVSINEFITDNDNQYAQFGDEKERKDLVKNAVRAEADPMKRIIQAPLPPKEVEPASELKAINLKDLDLKEGQRVSAKIGKEDHYCVVAGVQKFHCESKLIVIDGNGKSYAVGLDQFRKLNSEERQAGIDQATLPQLKALGDHGAYYWVDKSYKLPMIPPETTNGDDGEVVKLNLVAGQEVSTRYGLMPISGTFTGKVHRSLGGENLIEIKIDLGFTTTTDWVPMEEVEND